MSTGFLDRIARVERERMLLAAAAVCTLHFPLDLALAVGPELYPRILLMRICWVVAFVAGARLNRDSGHGHLELVNVILAGVTVLATTAMVWWTGGLQSPLLVWFPVFPALASVIAPEDTRAVVATSTMSTGGLICLLLLGSASAELAVVYLTLMVFTSGISIVGSLRYLRQRSAELAAQMRSDKLQAELRESEARREVAETLLRTQQLATLGGLAAGVAHELNNVVMALRFALERGRYDRAALADAEEAAGLIERLASEVTGAAAHEGPVHCALGDVLTSGVRLSRPHASERVRVDLGDSGEIWVRAHPGRLVHVVVNVLINAMQAMPEGGVVTVGVVEDSGFARVRVDDEGPGVPLELRERIFEPFFSSRRGSGGTGLGLALCRQSIEAMGGTLAVDESPAGGARFEICVPLGKAPVSA